MTSNRYGAFWLNKNQPQTKLLTKLLPEYKPAGSPDWLIIDATESNHHGIDAIREIKRFFATGPLHYQTKFCLVANAHILTPEAQNAFLKLLEEPPSHGLIALATQQPHKLLATVRSRLLPFSSSDKPTQRLNQPKLSRKTKNLFDYLINHTKTKQEISDLLAKDKDKLTQLLIEQVEWWRFRSLTTLDKYSIYCLKLSLYCLQLKQANVNPKLVADTLVSKFPDKLPSQLLPDD